MARLALLTLALVLTASFLPHGCNAQQEANVQSVLNTLEQYFRSLTSRGGEAGSERGRGEAGGRQWEWDQTAERGGAEAGAEAREAEGSTGSATTTSGSEVDRLTAAVEEMQIKLFMNDITSTSRGFQDTCPKLMAMLEQGFMKPWLADYIQRNRAVEGQRGESRNNREREGNWSNDFSRFLRGRHEGREFEGRFEGQREGYFEGREGRFENHHEGQFEGGQREGQFEGHHEGRFEGQREGQRGEGRHGGRREPISSFPSGVDAGSPLFQGLMASCYVFQDLVHGNAPLLEASRERAAQQ